MTENFFAEYSDALLVTLLVTGFFLGLLAARFCWGCYQSAIESAEHESVDLTQRLEGSRRRNRELTQ